MSATVLGNYRSIAAAEPPNRVADRMVRDGVLTPFQAALLLEGKSRPFFVGPYKVLSRIGNGSSGVVYLCEHVNMRRKVAVKVLQGRRAKDEVALQRFLREARAAAALNHPNVVHALDLGREGDLHYLSMEYVDGASLMALVRQEGPLAPQRLAGYLRQAAAGLAHAHAAGLIHRDITPSNVMIGRDGVVKLLDLGLALFAECEENLTQGAALGSLGYIAPEQALDSHEVDARSDIFSLGATIYFGMTGRAPNSRRGLGDTPAPKARPDAESDFELLLSIVTRMMAPSPADRFQTANEVVEVVSRWVPPPPPPGSNPDIRSIPPTPALPVPLAEPVAEPLDAGSETNSTDFALGSEPTDPKATATARPPRPTHADFAFDPVPRTPRPVKREKAARSAPEYSPPAPRVNPAPQPPPQAAPPARNSWVTRYWWVLMLVALFVGFGASLLVRSQRRTAADEIPRIPPRAVSPNSP